MARTSEFSEEILNKIQQMIQYNMKPGDRLPTENELCARLGASRTTVRECLKVLISQGVLVNKKGGKYVSESAQNYCDSLFHTMLRMDVCSLSDLLQVRNLLEVDVVSIIADRTSPAAIQKLEYIVWELQNPDITDDEFRATEIRFHKVMAEETHNKFLMDLLSSIRDLVVTQSGRPFEYQEKDRIIENRVRLVAALKDRNRSKAVALAQEHVEASRKFFGISSGFGPVPAQAE